MSHDLEELREDMINGILQVWDLSDDPWGQKFWGSVTKLMTFAGTLKSYSNAEKKQEVLTLLKILLDRTDSPGPDFVVDSFILWAVEFGIDALYDASKGRHDFSGSSDS